MRYYFATPGADGAHTRWGAAVARLPVSAYAEAALWHDAGVLYGARIPAPVGGHEGARPNAERRTSPPVIFTKDQTVCKPINVYLQRSNEEQTNKCIFWMEQAKRKRLHILFQKEQTKRKRLNIFTKEQTKSKPINVFFGRSKRCANDCTYLFRRSKRSANE